MSEHEEPGILRGPEQGATMFRHGDPFRGEHELGGRSPEPVVVEGKGPFCQMFPFWRYPIQPVHSFLPLGFPEAPSFEPRRLPEKPGHVIFRDPEGDLCFVESFQGTFVLRVRSLIPRCKVLPVLRIVPGGSDPVFDEPLGNHFPGGEVFHHRLVEHLTRAPQIPANGVHLPHDEGEETQILHPIRHEMEGLDVPGLTVTIHPTVPLLDPHGVPRDLLMDHVPAGGLEVQPLGGGIGGEQDPEGRERIVELLFDETPVLCGGTPEQDLHLRVTDPLLPEPELEVIKCVLVFGEDDDPFIIPELTGFPARATGRACGTVPHTGRARCLQVFPYPVHETLPLFIRGKGNMTRWSGDDDILCPAEGFQRPGDLLNVGSETIPVLREPACPVTYGIDLPAFLLLVIVHRRFGTIPGFPRLIEPEIGEVEAIHMLPPCPGEGIDAGQEPFREQGKDEITQHPLPLADPG